MEHNLSCDMVAGCEAPVSMIDRKGYLYCQPHGVNRRNVHPCRKLTKAELTTLTSGKPISWERVA